MTKSNQILRGPLLSDYLLKVQKFRTPGIQLIPKRPGTTMSTIKTRGQLPLVSVITIVRNAVGTLEKTIQSVLSQTYPFIEYIVVDGGSTDGTVELLQKYSRQISQYISEPDEGIYDAFNKGVALCHGEIIGTLNADDWYEPNGIELAIKPFLEEKIELPPVDFVCGSILYWKAEKPTYLFASQVEGLKRDTTINHPTVFVRLKVYKELGLFRTDLRLASDYDFFLRVFLSGKRMIAVSGTIANMSLGGLSDRRWVQVFRESLQIQLELLGVSWGPYRRFVFKVLRTTISRFLSRIGLEVIVEGYRSYFSILEKKRIK